MSYDGPMAPSRIMIIGGPGSGKTWLAARLGDRYSLPVHCVDHAVWDRHGKLRSNSEIDRITRAWAGEGRWVIEGGNTRTYGDRLARADTLIRLCPPRLLRMTRVFRRSGYRHELLWWTWRYDAVFGVKDRELVRLRPAKTRLIQIMSRGDLGRLLSEGVDGF